MSRARHLRALALQLGTRHTACRDGRGARAREDTSGRAPNRRAVLDLLLPAHVVGRSHCGAQASPRPSCRALDTKRGGGRSGDAVVPGLPRVAGRKLGAVSVVRSRLVGTRDSTRPGVHARRVPYSAACRPCGRDRRRPRQGAAGTDARGSRGKPHGAVVLRLAARLHRALPR